MATDWNKGDGTGKVSIGTHSLYISASGPERKKPNEPAVIIEAGMSSTSHEFVLVQNSISPFARVYSYDRAGLGYSEKSPEPLTIQNRAKELLRLLQAAKVPPPYVMVAHSYAGILVREFLELVGAGQEGVAGMVLVDTEQERNEIDQPFPMYITKLMKEEDDYYEIIGLKSNTLLGAEQFQLVDDLGKKGDAAAASEEEDRHYYADCEALAAKKQFERRPLGDARVSVIKGSTFADLSKLLAWADANEREPKEERERLRETLKDWDARSYALQKEQLKLSSQGRLVEATGIGKTHNLHTTQPEIIAKEVKWVLGIEE